MADCMSEEDLKKLKVVELKARLSSLGLHISGLKADLVARLHNYFVQQHQAPPAQQQQQQQQPVEEPLPQQQILEPSLDLVPAGGDGHDEHKYEPMRIISPSEAPDLVHVPTETIIKPESSGIPHLLEMKQEVPVLPAQSVQPVGEAASKPTSTEQDLLPMSVPESNEQSSDTISFDSAPVTDPVEPVALMSQSEPQDVAKSFDEKPEVPVTATEGQEQEESNTCVSQDAQQEQLQQQILQQQMEDERAQQQILQQQMEDERAQQQIQKQQMEDERAQQQIRKQQMEDERAQQKNLQQQMEDERAQQIRKQQMEDEWAQQQIQKQQMEGEQAQQQIRKQQMEDERAQQIRKQQMEDERAQQQIRKQQMEDERAQQIRKQQMEDELAQQKIRKRQMEDERTQQLQKQQMEDELAQQQIRKQQMEDERAQQKIRKRQMEDEWAQQLQKQQMEDERAQQKILQQQIEDEQAQKQQQFHEKQQQEPAVYIYEPQTEYPDGTPAEMETPVDSESEAKGKKKKKKKKKKRKKRTEVETNNYNKGQNVDQVQEEVEVDYIEEAFDILDPHYRQFAKIFEAFKLSEPEPKDAAPKKGDKKETVDEAKAQEAKDPLIEEDADDDFSDEEDTGKPVESDQPKLSKKKLRKLNRLSVAELKQLVPRPDVVEMHDVTAHDPKLLVFLKSCRNTVPVPRHWCFKRKYLQGKRGIVKPPFDLPDFIKKTGIMEMREAMQEKEDQKTMKAKMREKVRPKMGKIDIDYQKLHDAFFKWQTKPKMTIHGDLYYEGKEFETKLKLKKPGDLSDELRTALGMPIGPSSQLVPPPWLIAMQRYGPPPSYPNLKVHGLNAPIPEGASFGYHAGGWGKPPVDETGRPLYGDVFGIQSIESQALEEDDQIENQPWGELESEESEEESEEESSEEEDQTGLVTPADTGLITPSGLTSIPAGMETPDIIELRKRKNIEDAMESGADQASLYTVLPEKKSGVGAVMMGSTHVYEVPSAVPGGVRKAGAPLSEGVEVALDPSELELDPAAMQARYEQQLKERESQIQKEDLSDMVAEHAAKQKKRKKATDSGKAAKKYKEFKF